MKQIQTIVPVLVTLLMSAASWAESAGTEWELKRDRDGVQVYTRSVEGSAHKAVHATMSVPYKVNELVALVMDVTACPKWAALCKESHVAESVSPAEAYIYTYNDLPWPVTDRDAIAHVQWSSLAGGGAQMQARIVDEKVARKKKTIRLTTGITSWEFVPNAEGGTDVVSYAHLDPGGAVPAWLTNILLVDSPFDTMVGMRDLAATGKYQDAPIPFQ